jgi:sec-independent protein translocase protein TatA
MFGIGGGELIFILFIVLMLFGADKIPDIARTMGKAMAQLKHATNDIKNEIHKGAEANGLDKTFRELHGDFGDVSANINNEINKAKANVISKVTPEIESPQENTNEVSGPVKRQN